MTQSLDENIAIERAKNRMKSKPVAIILSMILPGIGHIYAGKTGRGFAYIVCFTLSFFVAFLFGYGLQMIAIPAFSRSVVLGIICEVASILSFFLPLFIWLLSIIKSCKVVQLSNDVILKDLESQDIKTTNTTELKLEASAQV